MVGFEEKPAHPRSDLANAGLYVFEPEVDRPHRRCDARRHRLPPAPAPRGSGRGGRHRRRVLHRHRHPRGARASVLVTGQGVEHGDRHPDPAPGRPRRWRHGPARVLPRARRPRAERRHRQVRLRRHQAALRRRHLRQLLPEGDRQPGRGRAPRPGPGGHAHGGRPPRRRDHDAGGHPLGRVRTGLLLGGDRRACSTPSSPTPVARCRRRSWPSGPAPSRSTAASKPIGKQDQYAAAFGGICDLRFGPGDRVTVDQIRLPSRRPAAAAGRADALLHRDHPQRRLDPRGADVEHRRAARAAEVPAGPRGRRGRRASPRRHQLRGSRPGQELGGQAGPRHRRVERSLSTRRSRRR